MGIVVLALIWKYSFMVFPSFPFVSLLVLPFVLFFCKSPTCVFDPAAIHPLHQLLKCGEAKGLHFNPSRSMSQNLHVKFIKRLSVRLLFWLPHIAKSLE